MRLQIHHETVYEYAEPVSYSIQTLKLTPRIDAGQRVLSWRVTSPGERLEQVDAFGNLSHVVTLESPHRIMRIAVDGVVDVDSGPAALLAAPGELSALAYLAPTPLTRPDHALQALADRHLGRHPPTAAALMDLVGAVGARVAYQPGATDVTHSATDALELGAGVCQDQTHVFIACCRALRIPARYVSGYFHAVGGDEVASHAWADVWMGAEEGWLSLDITHAEPAGERHCRLAVGRDYLDAAPVRGVRRGGGQESMRVTVQISGAQGQQQ